MRTLYTAGVTALLCSLVWIANINLSYMMNI